MQSIMVQFRGEGIGRCRIESAIRQVVNNIIEIISAANIESSYSKE